MPPHAIVDYDTGSSERCSDATSSTTAVSKPLSPTRASKKVTFDPHLQIHEIVNIRDLIHDVNELWFSYQEQESNRFNCQSIIDCLEFGVPLNEEQCVRGLECYTEAERDARLRNISEAVRAVIQEQDLQRFEGINDPYLLADIYTDSSYHCRVAAYIMGLQDRKNVLH